MRKQTITVSTEVSESYYDHRWQNALLWVIDNLKLRAEGRPILWNTLEVRASTDYIDNQAFVNHAENIEYAYDMLIGSVDIAVSGPGESDVDDEPFGGALIQTIGHDDL